MATLNIFVSFEYDKDYELKNQFFQQAKEHSPHKVKNSSLEESHETQGWEGRAEKAMRGCDVVIVLVGEDTHNAPGVKAEVRIAQRLKKPIFQVVPQRRPYKGMPNLEKPIRWIWKGVNKKLEAIAGRR